MGDAELRQVKQLAELSMLSVQDWGRNVTREAICIAQSRLKIYGYLLLQWFQAVDQDRSNAIDAAELQKALVLGNLHFSLAVCAHMIR